MVFVLENVNRTSSGANSNAPAFYSYFTSVDAAAAVETAGYFDDFATSLRVNDNIYAHATDGPGFYEVLTVTPQVIIGAIATIGAGGVGTSQIQDGAVTGPKLATPLTTTSGVTTATSSASATPGTIRAWTGKVTESNATMTSGNIVGVRGEVDMVGASGGFAYGVQGKVIPSGTLSGSIWAPAVFGQYDLSGATLNAGQIAAVWGDMGATGGTFTDVTGARMFAGTNTIASLTLNAMDYRYGKASNLFELAGDAGTYITAGAATPSGDMKKIAITIDGVKYYILAAAVWS